MFWHDDGYFVVNLYTAEDKNDVPCLGPQLINGKPAIVKPWTDKFNFHDEILKTIHFG